MLRIRIMNLADAPTTVADLKDTGVTSVDLRGNNTTLVESIECLFSARAAGICVLGINNSDHPAFIAAKAQMDRPIYDAVGQHLPQELAAIVGEYDIIHIMPEFH